MLSKVEICHHVLLNTNPRHYSLDTNANISNPIMMHIQVIVFFTL